MPPAGRAAAGDRAGRRLKHTSESQRSLAAGGESSRRPSPSWRSRPSSSSCPHLSTILSPLTRKMLTPRRMIVRPVPGTPNRSPRWVPLASEPLDDDVVLGDELVYFAVPIGQSLSVHPGGQPHTFGALRRARERRIMIHEGRVEVTVNSFEVTVGGNSAWMKSSTSCLVPLNWVMVMAQRSVSRQRGTIPTSSNLQRVRSGAQLRACQVAATAPARSWSSYACATLVWTWSDCASSCWCRCGGCFRSTPRSLRPPTRPRCCSLTRTRRSP